jgi:NitT/TauT family transport system substrate-binding protein
MKRKTLTAFVAAAALATTVAGCSSSSHGSSGSAGSGGSSSSGGSNSGGGTTNVTIAVDGLSKQIYLPAMLAQQLGFFKQQGLNVTLADQSNGAATLTQMLSGQVAGAVGFYDHNVDLQTKGKATESVVQLLQVPGEVLLVRSDEANTYTSPSKLAGSTAGVTAVGSSTQFLIKYLAVHNNVDVKTMKWVNAGAGPTMVAAFTHKAVDVGMTTQPTVAALLSKGEAKIMVDMRTVAGTKAALGGIYPASCLYMSTAWVNSHQQTVQKIVNAFVETLKWIQTHSAAQIAAEMPPSYYAGVGKQAYTQALAGEIGMFDPNGLMPTGGPQTVLNVLSAFDPNVMGHQIDLSKTYTDQFAQAAQNQ